MHAIKSFFKISLFLLALFLLGSCEEGETIPEEIIYTISFESNSGSEVLDITEMLGTSINQPTDPTRSGYTFRGWYYDEELTELVSWPLVITTNLTLYAKWSENDVELTTYDVIFNTMGGSQITSLEVDKGTIISKPVNPTKDGYTFVNWYLEESYTTLANFPITVTSNLTLYAKWEQSNTNHVNFSYYELSEVNISKTIYSGLNQYYGEPTYFLTSDGKILTKERIFNQLTHEKDWMYVELPIPLSGSLSNERIIDVIVYEPVVLFKIESGRWFGIEIGQYATGDYLGVANEVISIDLMLD
ncbi:MAG: InlB B-repeat-containing protein, partial [Acholeplasmataceae bacterium]|nr:InlB B-repeat-containing protein [Acholeplasmataceae bacterium]